MTDVLPGLPPLFNEAPHPLDGWPARYTVGLLSAEIAGRDEGAVWRPRPESRRGRRRHMFGVGAHSDSRDDLPTWVDPIAAWRHLAACNGTGDTQPARSTCCRCQVRWTCLDYALTAGEEHGRWGGFSASARATLLRRHRDDPAEALIAAWQAEHPEGPHARRMAA